MNKIFKYYENQVNYNKMKKREIVFVLSLLALFLLTACKSTEQEATEKQVALDESKIVIKLEHPEEVSSDEEFSVKISITNSFDVPATLSSVTFPFSDFKFNGDFVIYPNAIISPQETNIMEYNVKRNMEANLGSELISSLMQFDFKIEGSDLSKNEDFVLEFI